MNNLLLKLAREANPQRRADADVEANWFVQHAVAIVSAVVNIAVLFGDWRLARMVARVTGGDWLQAAFVALIGGLGFILWWDISWHYPLADKWQKWAAGVMAVASLLYTAWGGYLSLAVEVGASVNLNALAEVATALLLAHIVAGVVFVFTDPAVTLRRQAAQSAALYRHQSRQVAQMEGLLKQLQNAAQTYAALTDEYGGEVVAEVASALGIDKSEGKGAATPARLAASTPATTMPARVPHHASTPDDVLAASSNNGHHPASTPAGGASTPPFGG